MLSKKYRSMLGNASVIMELAAFASARAREIGAENVFDFSLGNPSVPEPRAYDLSLIHIFIGIPSNRRKRAMPLRWFRYFIIDVPHADVNGLSKKFLTSLVDGGAPLPRHYHPHHNLLEFSVGKLWPQIVQGSDFCSGKWDFPTQKSAPAPDVHAVGAILLREGCGPLALSLGV